MAYKPTFMAYELRLLQHPNPDFQLYDPFFGCEGGLQHIDYWYAMLKQRQAISSLDDWEMEFREPGKHARHVAPWTCKLKWTAILYRADASSTKASS